MVHAVEVEAQRQAAERVAFGFAYQAGFLHLFEDGVAAFEGAFGVAYGVVVCRVFDHTHQQSRFLNVEVACLLIEVYLSGRFDAHGVVQKVELVEVHLDNFFLGVVALKFDGYHPLDGLLHGAFEDAVARRSVQQLGQLLGDGGSAARAFVA